MGEGLLVGFESARLIWRCVGERIALRNQPAESRRPLLVRLLFEDGRGVNMSEMPRRTRVTTIPGSIAAEKIEQVRADFGLASDRLHACVSRQAGRRFVSGATCHLMTGSYPMGSFFEIGEGVLVVSPELAFIQMSRVLDRDLLIAYGYELCGYYARGRVAHTFYSCPALTSVARILRYLSRLEELRLSRGEGMPWGLERAREALAYVRNGSASPEESVTSMVLTMPRRLGGYGLSAGSLNARVRLSPAAAELFGIDEFVCDICWVERRQVVEFQGAQHKQRSRRSYDMRKGNVLSADGWRVVEVDRYMLERGALMDEVAKSVAKGLGKRWKKPDGKTATRQLRLRNKLIRDLDGG